MNDDQKTVHESELIWIQDAIKEYHRARSFWYSEIHAGRLATARLPGDLRTYLIRAEVEARLKFAPVVREVPKK